MNSQKSVKIKFSLVAALALSFVIALGAFLGITLARADRTVTISGTSIFVTDGAEVWAHQEGDEGVGKDHTMFVFDDNKDAVNFKKNLAFKWVENVAEQEKAPEKDGETEEGAEETPFNPEIHFEAKDGWFNLEIGFNYGEGIEFEKFVITFESQQYSQTKDGKATNYIVFAPDEDDNSKLSVYIFQKETADKDLDAALKKVGQDTLIGTVEANERININFVDPKEHKDMPVEGGDYLVQVSNGDGNKYVGTFKNINKTYAKYSSSSTTPVTPLSFKAMFKEQDGNGDGDITATGEAFLTLYKLNNQSFEVSGAKDVSGHRAGGTINDTTPPVLCLDKAVPFIQYNKEISFDYTVIDVLTSSPSLTTSYYMLTKTGVNDNPVYKEEDGAYKGAFKTVSDSDNQYIFPHAKHYLPTDEAGDLDGTVFKNDKNFEVKAAVKVVLKLTDTTSTGGQTTYVYLDWFVDNAYLLQIGEDGNKVPYIAVTEDNQGATYAYTKDGASNPNLTGDNVNAEWKKIVDDYQAKVTEAAKDLKAGSKNYFYLPSAETLFADNATAYADLTFSIYYNNGSQQQSTGKNANGLSINLTKAGKYVFTIYAKDAAGNNMYYFDEDGEEQELETVDIWSMYKEDKKTEFAGMKKYLPWFEFNVEGSELSIEDPDEQSTAYVGSTYTPDSFEINGVSFKTEYKLYEFNNDDWAKNNGGKAMTYEEFSGKVATLLLTDRQYFTLIRPTGDLKEGTKDYEDFNEYGWDGSSLSFTPQTDNTFYVIKCEAKRSANDDDPETGYMTIAAAPKVNPLKGEDTWVQDNITSIILLCIAGASLIGIILLLVIKPKNNGDIDEVIDTPKKKKKN